MNPLTLRAAARRLPDLGTREPFDVYRLSVTSSGGLVADRRDSDERRVWLAGAAGGDRWSDPQPVPPDPDGGLRRWFGNVCRLFARFTAYDFESPALDPAAREQFAADRSAWSYARELSDAALAEDAALETEPEA